MIARILGAVPIVEASGDRGLVKGASSRDLADAAWIPARLGSGPGLEWTPIDEHTAEATMEDRGVSVSLRFTFDCQGDPVEVFGVRARAQGGEYVDTQCIGRFGDHEDFGGFRLPAYGEVAWIIDGTEQPYSRGTIIATDYTSTR